MGLLKENELSANKAAAFVMRITALIYSLALILDIAGIFTIKLSAMITGFVLGSIMLIIPTVIVNLLKRNDVWVKYIIVACAVAFTVIAAVYLSWHVVILYVYPIAVASLYFSGSLNFIVTLTTIIGVSAAQIISFDKGYVLDDNFTNLRKAIIFGIVPRGLVLFCISAIFTMLCRRTTTMLGSLMSAEKQNIMREKSLEVSEKLLSTVIGLDKIAKTTAEANYSVATEAEGVMNDSEDNFRHIEVVENNMNVISENLSHLSDMSSSIAELTERANEITDTNDKKMFLAAESMNEICKGTDESKDIIQKLTEQSEKITEIVDVIADISMQTNILALNASIEAKHAGEYGKGFSVVAGEIKALSEKTKESAADINEIIRQVAQNISRTVSSMEKNSELTREGMIHMEEMKKSAEQISASNSEISKYIVEMNDIIRNVAISGENVSHKLVSVSGNVKNNCEAVQQVAEAIKKNSSAAEKLGVTVGEIKTMAFELEKLSK